MNKPDNPINTNIISELLSQEKCLEIIQGMYQGKALLGPEGLLTPLVKEFTQIALQGEMTAQLEEKSLEQGSNRRNGISTKTMKSASGPFELEVPRDRNSSFEPQLIKKRQTILNEELDNKILALYGLGTSYEGISSYLQEITVLRFQLLLYQQSLINWHQ